MYIRIHIFKPLLGYEMQDKFVSLIYHKINTIQMVSLPLFSLPSIGHGVDLRTVIETVISKQLLLRKVLKCLFSVVA